MRSFGRLLCLLVTGSVLSGVEVLAQGNDVVSQVDPFIGTAKSAVFTRWGSEGGTYPGAVAPWGFLQLTPETRAEGGYEHGDPSIFFFSCFHHLSGFPGGSAGQIKLMPVADSLPGMTGRPFLHRDERASPGYYSVTFSDDHTKVEATTSTRVGLFRVVFPAHVTPRIFVGGMGEIVRKTSHSLQGSSFPVVLQYDRDDSGEEPVKDGLILRWAPSAGKPTVVVLRISVAGAGAESAQKNIDKETGALGFDGVKEKTRAEWRKELSVISLGDDREHVASLSDKEVERKKIFYTALYHSLLIPWIISDVEGRYRGRDGQVHKATGKNEYGQFSPWDTFRSLHPLLSLLFPDRQRDIVLSMLDIYRQTGYLPTESMTGNHAIAILVDSWMKGIHGFDSALTYAAMRKSLVEGPFLQPDMEVYHERGYIPFTYPESVTRTVEYAYDDWALSQFIRSDIDGDDVSDGLSGRAIGSGEHPASVWKGSYAYRNLFNPDELFLLPRDGDLFKVRPGTTGYKEGDKWVYSFFVPQHPKDLVNLMGGAAAFTARLDSALADQSIVFDNETVFHIPYLFNYSGRPDRTQYWIKTIMDKRWSATPGGLPGNDDLGSLSSWYVLSALGIYPLCPGRPFYDIGIPLFREARLHLPGGKQFLIRVRGDRDGQVRSLLVNNKRLEGLMLPHEWIVQGSEMVFDMGQEPGTIGSMTGREPEWVAGRDREPAGEPEFRLSDISLSRKEVAPNELFWVRFSVCNKGAMGTKIVKLLVNGRSIGHKNCLVASGAALTDSIGCRLYPYGVAKLGIEGMTEVEVLVRADREGRAVSTPDEDGQGALAITGLVIRPVLANGERQRLSFTAQNIGGVSRTFYIPVRVDDSLVRTDSILLEPGEKREVLNVLAVGGQGGAVQQVKVMGVREKFKVYQRGEESLVLDLSMERTGDSVVADRSGFGNQGKIFRG